MLVYLRHWFGCSFPRTAFCQTQKLGIVKYTPPPGWTKTQQQPNVIAFSTLNQTTGAFCIITLYGATPGTGNPQSDFTREWNNLVVQNMKAEANPPTETAAEDGWTAIGGGAAVDVQGTKGIAFLTVISGFGKTVSVLAVLTDQSYLPQVQAFIAGIEMDKTVAPANNTNPPTRRPSIATATSSSHSPRASSPLPILWVSGGIIPGASRRHMLTAPPVHTLEPIRFTSRASGRSTRMGDTPMISSR